MVTIDFKLVDIKLKSSEAYLLKFGKKSVVGFSYLVQKKKISVKMRF